MDPVVQAAMIDLKSWVYPPLRERLRRYLHGQGRWERNLQNPSNRAATVHACKHLKYHGHDFQPDQLRDWAMAHGWKGDDADELHDDAEGVLAGRRYHTRSDPFGRAAIKRWREDAARNAAL
jgi:hypothetical protein